MTTAVSALSQRQVGLFMPTGSRGRSDSAAKLERILDENRSHLWSSFAISDSTVAALDELDALKAEAAHEGWNGDHGAPIQAGSFAKAHISSRSSPCRCPGLKSLSLATGRWPSTGCSGAVLQ